MSERVGTGVRVGTIEYEYHLPPEVTIVVKDSLPRAFTIVRHPSKPEDWDSIPEGVGEERYYTIEQVKGKVSKGNIKIRIIAPASAPETRGQIFELTGEQWEDRTLYSVNVGQNKLVVGVIDHLSGFGIRT
jgi:hypothetical protein